MSRPRFQFIPRSALGLILATSRGLLVGATLAAFGGGSLRAADACCASTPETRLWDRFAEQAKAIAAHGGNPLPVLKAPPADVTDLSLAELFVAGSNGALEYSPKAQRLRGTLVRIAGFMVKQQTQAPGLLLFTARPFSTQENEDGFCENLPAATLHVVVPELARQRVPLTAGPLALVGRLELGSHLESDGRNSVARLVLTAPSPFSPDPLPASASGPTAATH